MINKNRKKKIYPIKIVKMKIKKFKVKKKNNN